MTKAIDMGRRNAIIATAEMILYSWACGNIQANEVIRRLKALGLSCDLRQPDSNEMDAVFITTGEPIILMI